MQSLVIGTVLFTVVGTLLYVPAVIGYFTLYYKYLPQLETTVPVHLQYGYGCFKITHLSYLLGYSSEDTDEKDG